MAYNETNHMPETEALRILEKQLEALTNHTAYIHSKAEWLQALSVAIRALQECIIYRKAVEALRRGRV